MIEAAQGWVYWVGNGGLVLVVSTMVYAILAGKVVPKKVVDDQVKELKEVVTLWRTAAEDRDEVIKELTPLIRQGVENDRVVVNMITAMKTVVDSIVEKETR